MKKLLTLVFSISSLLSFGQEIDSSNTVSLLFIGDIMGHDPQIEAAYDSTLKKYNYDDVFEKISPIIKSVDFAIGNLEVTLAGSPYKGYPQFSSPDELAVSCKNSGIDLLVTANNHSCDRRKKGILRTIKVLDSLDIKHTGTFRNKEERDTTNLAILTKGNIKVGILNYTYGTNGIPVPKSTIVNLIDKRIILADIKASKKDSLDKLIVIMHWGSEYKSHPNKKQESMADFLFGNGVDIIIGSHPHVLQRMEYHQGNDSIKERFIAYSLGNFVSNQRTRRRDGGAMVELTLSKTEDQTTISDKGYHLYWVNKPLVGGVRKFEVIPSSQYKKNEYLDKNAISKMNIFLSDTRVLYKSENINVDEIK